jgi:Na+/proline symporter
MNTSLWPPLGLLCIVLLVVYWRNRNAVWGGLSIGIVVGLLTAVGFAIWGDGFSWRVVAKISIVVTLLGFGAELLAKTSNYVRRRSRNDIL